ncbi:twin-arginine translocase subunit TatC [Helicobacter turcicus]|uniref:Sec-independent protein translocase protein TatC n=1 Tax=Helicobacter turcicus TaxID=2867412 RepID=A0ABS7JNF4_9HELI|nr:twin-arginine translocase subunit TatC [Helicobacter turcicus]MBX7490910.1 twin-arginine translocase subunit TatC [Helicobacter turcicus]MBX7545764.1 twin-arginine translocase subunit TatC [Helicobacter turcicus]
MLEDLKPHIQDLRRCLIRIAIALLITFSVAFYFWEIILNWMVEPLSSALPNGRESVIFTQVGEAFFTALKVAFFSGFIFALPVIFWQIWAFVAPGLYDNEKRLVIPFVIFGTFFFLCGCAFAYYIAFPIGFGYLINFGSQLFTALPSIGEYVGFFAKLMIGFGVSFELPVITFFLAKIGLVTDKTLKDYFKFAIVFIFILAAILTPPDVLSQFLMAIPLTLLYGISIIIAKMVNPYKEEPLEYIKDSLEEA